MGPSAGHGESPAVAYRIHRMSNIIDVLSLQYESIELGHILENRTSCKKRMMHRL